MGARMDEKQNDGLVFALTGAELDAGWLRRGCDANGLGLQCYDNLTALASALHKSSVDRLVLFTAYLPSGQALADILDLLRRSAGRPLQEVCFAPSEDLSQRLDALRAGCVGFHLLPLDDEGLADALSTFKAPQGEQPRGRVLVVDDVPLEATLAQQVLEQAGFEARALSDELAILATIREFEPDLIIMDLNMPRASGAELTAIIRDHEEMLLTPIVFLSGEQDQEARRQALQLGADEFLIKPVDPATLVDTVQARLRRSQRIQRRFVPAEDLDEATGLLTRRSFLRGLGLQCAALADTHTELAASLLFLSVDNAETLLKHGGIGAEDKLLAHIGTELRGAVGPGDRAARFGQFSFTVLAMSSGKTDPTEIAQGISAKLRDHVLQLGNSQHRLSLSIGAARVTGQADAITLISLAESACWRARRQGMGRIMVHAAEARRASDESRSSAGPDATLAERVISAAADAKLEVGYRPLMALASGADPLERYSLEAWLPADESTGVAASRVDAGGLPAGDFCALLDVWLMEQALAVVEQRLAEKNGAPESAPIRLFVPQRMLSLRGRRWVLWMRDRLNALGPRSLGSIVLVVDQEDVLGQLGIANALFPLLGRLRLRLCIRGINTQPAGLSLLDDYPIAFVEPAAEVLASPPERGELEKLVNKAHAGETRVIVAGIDDSGAMSRAWQSRADFGVGDFVQPLSSRMDFDFEGGFGG
jgi:diguanylate cyclase (GGDEF)-like protein